MTKWRPPRSVPWETPYPLPRDTAQILLDREGECDNAGLLTDRFLAYADTRWGPEFVREFLDRRAITPDYTPHADLIAAFRTRWEEIASAMGATTFSAMPEWRVVIGLGTHKLLEGGMTLHRVYGIPIIPATTLKGVARLYAEAVAEAPAEMTQLLFGEAEPETRQGDLIFLDGVPAEPPEIERDVMNPHWAMYYGGAENVPPADYMSPRPIFFLTVGKRSLFRFGVASAKGDPTAVEQGAEWLKRGLQDLGVGAKTAAGYGYWVIEDQ